MSITIAGLDYITAMASVSITSDDSSSNLVIDGCLTVDIIDDSIDEENEQFLVSIINVEADVRIGEPSMSIITIVDNDG